MVRPLGKHIDSRELDILMAARGQGDGVYTASSAIAIEAVRHVESCPECLAKVLKYCQLVERLTNAWVHEAAPAHVDCPRDVDWDEVATGLWPEMKAAQLISHAALCDHCGPLLRAATAMNADTTPHEEKMISELKAPWRPNARVAEPATSWRSLEWLVPVAALLLIVGIVGTKNSHSPSKRSGQEFAQFAVNTYKQHEQGTLAFDFRADSQQAVNGWLKSQLPFALTLPASPAAPGEARPYQVEGARLVRFGGNTAAFVAYHVQEMREERIQSSDASLLVVPDSVAVASGGAEANFGKVNFHYATVQKYRVVTWSMHGLTYALVSQESNRTQQSCMVCHSEIRDRDLTHTPTPLHDDQIVQPRLQ